MTGLYNGVAGLSGSSGLWGNVAGLWSGATGLQDGSGGPALSLNFLSGTLDSRITFTRSSTATFVGSNGFIQTAAINTPRFDYNPVTLAAKGLLIEEQRTNLLVRSEEFDNASWTLQRSTVTANATTSPDGTVDADRLVDDTATGTHRIFQGAAKAASAIAYTASVYIKADTLGFATLRIAGVGEATYTSVGINLTTGELSALSTFGFTSASATVTNAGNGWWRLQLTGTSDTTTSISALVGTANSLSANSSYTGTGSGSIYVWGAQLEAGAFATSYIPTVASQVTRTADVPSMTGTNFSSWYAGPQGTFVCEFTANNPAVSSRALWVADNSTGRILDVYISGIAPNRVDVYSNHTLSGLYGLGTFPTPNTIIKVAATMGENDSAAVANGGAVVVDNATGVPLTATRLVMGQYNSISYLNGHIRSVTYYNSRLTNAQLQALSTP